MSDCFIVRRGGGGLNFSVKAYESELLIPETARENTVAVVTETSITAYTIAASEPASPVDGMVWILMDVLSNKDFAAVVKNPVMVYPSTVKQYENGAWMRKTAKIYQNGAWEVLGVTYVYNQGNLCSELTGGYTTLGTNYGASTVRTAPVATYGTQSVTVERAGSEGAGVWYAKNKIDLTNYNKLCMIGELYSLINSYQATQAFGAFKNVGATLPWNEHVAAAAYVGGQQTQRVTNPVVDISNLSGSYYIGVAQYVHHNPSYATANIEKIYLE